MRKFGIRWLLATLMLLALGPPAQAFPWFPWLRITIPITPWPVPGIPDEPSYGVQLTGIVPNSPADRAGLELGDIILKVDTHRVRTISDAALALGLAANQRAHLVIFDQTTGRRETGYVYPGRGGWIGINGREVPAPQRGYGLKVTEVWPSSPADRAGLQVGDIIIRVDAQRVSRPREFALALRASNDTAYVTYLNDRWGVPRRTVVAPNAFGRIGVRLERVPLTRGYDRDSERYPY